MSHQQPIPFSSTICLMVVFFSSDEMDNACVEKSQNAYITLKKSSFLIHSSQNVTCFPLLLLSTKRRNTNKIKNIWSTTNNESLDTVLSHELINYDATIVGLRLAIALAFHRWIGFATPFPSFRTQHIGTFLRHRFFYNQLITYPQSTPCPLCQRTTSQN